MPLQRKWRGEPIDRGQMMTIYRSKTELILTLFRYQSGLETMDFKYPYPDWLERVCCSSW